MLRTALALGLFAVSSTVVSLPAAAQTDDAAAQAMINDPNPATFAVYGLNPAPKSKKDESVQGGRSITVPTTGSGNVWDISVNVPITKPIKAGDKLVMMYYAKLAKSPEGQATARINAQMQLAAAPYTVVIGGQAEVGPEWKLFTVEGKADKDYSKGSLNTTFHLNTGKQTIAIGLVAVFDYGQ
jgi:hypothetical protein